MSKFEIGSEYKSKDGRRHIKIIDADAQAFHYKNLISGGESFFLKESVTYEEMEFFK